MKAKLIRSVLAVFAALATVMFISCSALLEDGQNGNVTINLPSISSSARAISSDKINDLKTETTSYRVSVEANGQRTEKSGGGGNYSFTVPVGVTIEMTVECLNSSGQVIARAVKTHTVTGGVNNISIKLSRDGELVGAEGGTPPAPVPDNNPFNVNITIGGVSIGSVQDKLDGDDITNDIIGFLSSSDINNKRYGLTNGSASKTFTATKGQTTLDVNADVEVKAVKLTLSSDAITSDGSSPGYYKADFAGTKNAPAWYDIGSAFPTPTIKVNGVATTNVRFDVWTNETISDYTSVVEDAAGKTLKAFVYVKQASLHVKHFFVTGLPGNFTYRDDDTGSMSNITTKDLPDRIPFGTTISSRKDSDKNVITITIPGETGVSYEFSTTMPLSYTSRGCAISTVNQFGDPNFPNDGSEEDDILYTVEGIAEYSDIYLAIYWNKSH